jgi:hypothetical protein
MSFRVSIFSFGLLPLALCLPGCADTDPEEPGIEKPVVTGVVTGDIKTRREYADAVEAANKRNAARGTEGDWRHVKPAVGPAE